MVSLLHSTPPINRLSAISEDNRLIAKYLIDGFGCDIALAVVSLSGGFSGHAGTGSLQTQEVVGLPSYSSAKEAAVFANGLKHFV